MLNLDIQKFAACVADVEAAVVRHRYALPPLRIAPDGDGDVRIPPTSDPATWQEVPIDTPYGSYARTVWLRGELALPSECAGQAVDLIAVLGDYDPLLGRELLGGPEALAYLDGAAAFGIDRRHAAHQLTASAVVDARHTLLIEVYCGRIAHPQHVRRYELAVRDPACAALAADLRAALDVRSILDPESSDAIRLHRALNAAVRALDFAVPQSDAFYASCVTAREAFARELAGYVHGTRPQIIATGHAHIDTAWFWPVSQTRRKVARTFATALRLMEQYPEYHFTASQPQQYQYLKEDEPALYAQVKARIAEGRWEPTGAMWIEPDLNVPRGESLVRQLVYGQRFFMEEFGKPASLVWLPDTFGYSWALPQLMRGAGVSHFMTSKISWNQFNRFPYDTFRWRGVDGSDVLAHFITTPDPDPDATYFTYNGHMTADEIAGTYRIYQQKEINDHLLYLYGWGDGGGGPTREMLEAGRRYGNLPGMPALVQGSAEESFRQIEANATAPANADRLPTWHGELYFEYHRGTYTSQGRTKYAHRRAEYLLHEAELWTAVAHATDAALPGEALDEAWRLLLLQEFHDILPGSSIPVVYEDALRDLDRVREIAERAATAATTDITAAMVGRDNLLVAFNGLSVPHTGLITATLPPGFHYVDSWGNALAMQDQGEVPGFPMQHIWLIAPPAGGVPPHGYTVFTHSAGNATVENALTATETGLENAFYRLTLDAHGQIISLTDKRYGDREVIAPGEAGNRLIAFEDKPLNYDAWDIDIFYTEKPTPLDTAESITVIERGPLRASIEIVRRYLSSTITQRISLYRDSPRIDFATDIDWHEHQILLKAAFPVSVLAATAATYEIQFGTVERPTHANTSWDAARFEVCAQRWADLSETGYGVALLNDGKYGYDVHGHTLRLTLLKSGISPDPNADNGRHQFTYSLLPHAGDWREGDVIAHAAQLNLPLRVVMRMADPVSEPQPYASGERFVTTDRTGLYVDTVKPANDGRGVIVRLYEGHGSRGPASLSFARSIASAEECDLLERRTGDVALQDAQTLTFSVRPYEVKTFRVAFRGDAG